MDEDRQRPSNCNLQPLHSIAAKRPVSFAVPPLTSSNALILDCAMAMSERRPGLIDDSELRRMEQAVLGKRGGVRRNGVLCVFQLFRQSQPVPPPYCRMHPVAGW